MMCNDEILSKIKDKLKNDDYTTIEHCNSIKDSIFLRKPVKKIDNNGILTQIICKVDSTPIPLFYTRIVNKYELLYELEIIK